MTNVSNSKVSKRSVAVILTVCYWMATFAFSGFEALHDPGSFGFHVVGLGLLFAVPRENFADHSGNRYKTLVLTTRATTLRHLMASLSKSLPQLRFEITEAARILRISRATLYQRIRGGSIAVQKDGRRTFITATEIHRYVTPAR